MSEVLYLNSSLSKQVSFRVNMRNILIYPEHPINLKFVGSPDTNQEGSHGTIATNVAVMRISWVDETRRKEALAVVWETVILVLVGTGKNWELTRWGSCSAHGEGNL